MNGKETNRKIEKTLEVGPETAARSLAVSLGRKVLSDLVLGFSALTVIGVLKLLQSHSESIVLFGMETVTTAVLSIWLTVLLLSAIPSDLYERMNTIDKFSFKQIAISVLGIVVWYATFFFVTRFVASTVAGLGIAAAN